MKENYQANHHSQQQTKSKLSNQKSLKSWNKICQIVPLASSASKQDVNSQNQNKSINDFDQFAPRKISNSSGASNNQTKLSEGKAMKAIIDKIPKPPKKILICRNIQSLESKQKIKGQLTERKQPQKPVNKGLKARISLNDYEVKSNWRNLAAHPRLSLNYANSNGEKDVSFYQQITQEIKNQILPLSQNNKIPSIQQRQSFLTESMKNELTKLNFSPKRQKSKSFKNQVSSIIIQLKKQHLQFKQLVINQLVNQKIYLQNLFKNQVKKQIQKQIRLIMNKSNQKNPSNSSIGSPTFNEKMSIKRKSIDHTIDLNFRQDNNNGLKIPMLKRASSQENSIQDTVSLPSFKKDQINMNSQQLKVPSINREEQKKFTFNKNDQQKQQSVEKFNENQYLSFQIKSIESQKIVININNGQINSIKSTNIENNFSNCLGQNLQENQQKLSRFVQNICYVPALQFKFKELNNPLSESIKISSNFNINVDPNQNKDQNNKEDKQKRSNTLRKKISFLRQKSLIGQIKPQTVRNRISGVNKQDILKDKSKQREKFQSQFNISNKQTRYFNLKEMRSKNFR